MARLLSSIFRVNSRSLRADFKSTLSRCKKMLKLFVQVKISDKQNMPTIISDFFKDFINPAAFVDASLSFYFEIDRKTFMILGNKCRNCDTASCLSTHLVSQRSIKFLSNFKLRRADRFQDFFFKNKMVSCIVATAFLIASTFELCEIDKFNA